MFVALFDAIKWSQFCHCSYWKSLYLKCCTPLVLMPVWQLSTRRQALTLLIHFPDFYILQKVGITDFRFPLALADPPPPHSLCITGLAAHNRWLSLFSSPQSRPSPPLSPRESGRERGVRTGSSGLMLNFTPHSLGISKTRSWWTGRRGCRAQVGAVYWCLTSRVCLTLGSTVQALSCLQLWQLAH